MKCGYTGAHYKPARVCVFPELLGCFGAFLALLQSFLAQQHLTPTPASNRTESPAGCAYVGVLRSTALGKLLGVSCARRGGTGIGDGDGDGWCTTGAAVAVDCNELSSSLQCLCLRCCRS